MRVAIALSIVPRRCFSVRQLVYPEYGNPTNVLCLVDNEIDENSLKKGQVLVRWRASPVNPADINQIQGVYPVKPPLPAVAGNEACGVVEMTGDSTELKTGDLVIPTTAGLGTWCSHGIYESTKLFPIDPSIGLVEAATIMVNPSTAYRMLKDFVKLLPGDLVLQNGSNSAVGRYIIQICRILGFQSVNIVRNRPNINILKKELEELGTSKVFTEEEFAKIPPKSSEAKLALNCVGGRNALLLARSLASGGCLVTYGGMSQLPVQVPTTSLIFGDIQLHGFWMSRWYDERQQNMQDRRIMYAELIEWYKSGRLTTPPYDERRLEDYKEAIQQATQQRVRSQRKQVLICD